MNTPTPEQSFKEWFDDLYKNREFNPNFTPHLEELCTAYLNHVLMKPVMEVGKFYPQNHETMLRGQIAALQRQVNGWACMAGGYADEIKDLQQQIAALQELVDNLRLSEQSWKNMYDASKEVVKDLQQQLTEAKQQINTLERFRVEDAASALDEINRLHTQLTEARKEIEVLKAKLPIECDHNWVSSAAYKGARVCSKCQKYK